MNITGKRINIENVLQFISYFYQYELPKRQESKRILEIGIGDKTTSNYLRQHGFDIITCDIDINKKPDFVGDIKQLPINNNSFDTVLSYEVLEHLEWKYINQVLEELHRITNKTVIISIPYSSHHFEFIIKFPLIRKILKKDFIDFFLRIPVPIKDIKFVGEPHFWEIGRKSFSLKKFKKSLERKFKIIDEVRPLLHSYHYFFVLKKR